MQFRGLTNGAFYRMRLSQRYYNCKVIEDYPEDKRGHSCLVYGKTEQDSDLHIVCGIGDEMLWIITVYEPDPEEWGTPLRRRQKWSVLNVVER